MTRRGLAGRTGLVLGFVMAAFWVSGLIYTLTFELATGQRMYLLGLLAAIALLTIVALRPQTSEKAIYLILGLQLLITFAASLVVEGLNVLIPVPVILAVVRLPPPWGLLSTVPFLVMNMVSAIYLSGLPSGIGEGLVTTLIIFSVAVFAYSLLRADEARAESQRLLQELEEAYRRLKEYAEQVEQLTIAEERNRLSRDMHDTLGHHLTVSIVQLEGAERIMMDQPERAARKVDAVRQQLEEALTELRGTVAMLRTPISTDLSLPRALKQLARDFERATELDIHVAVPDSLPPLPDSYRLALHRAAQEGLTNVQRHAHATNASLSLRLLPEEITLEITDDGVGITDGMELNGFGIRGIRERASQLDGKVEIVHPPEQGTSLVVRLPRGWEDLNGAT